MSTITAPNAGTFVCDPGFPEIPDLVYTEDQLVSASAVRLLDALLASASPWPAVEAADGIEDLAELNELGYVTVEDPTGGSPVITVTDFGRGLLAGVQAHHPDVLTGD